MNKSFLISPDFTEKNENVKNNIPTDSIIVNKRNIIYELSNKKQHKNFVKISSADDNQMIKLSLDNVLLNKKNKSMKLRKPVMNGGDITTYGSMLVDTHTCGYNIVFPFTQPVKDFHIKLKQKNTVKINLTKNNETETLRPKLLVPKIEKCKNRNDFDNFFETKSAKSLNTTWLVDSSKLTIKMQSDILDTDLMVLSLKKKFNKFLQYGNNQNFTVRTVEKDGQNQVIFELKNNDCVDDDLINKILSTYSQICKYPEIRTKKSCMKYQPEYLVGQFVHQSPYLVDVGLNLWNDMIIQYIEIVNEHILMVNMVPSLKMLLLHDDIDFRTIFTNTISKEFGKDIIEEGNTYHLYSSDCLKLLSLYTDKYPNNVTYVVDNDIAIENEYYRLCLGKSIDKPFCGTLDVNKKSINVESFGNMIGYNKATIINNENCIDNSMCKIDKALYETPKRLMIQLIDLRVVENNGLYQVYVKGKHPSMQITEIKNIKVVPSSSSINMSLEPKTIDDESLMFSLSAIGKWNVSFDMLGTKENNSDFHENIIVNNYPPKIALLPQEDHDFVSDLQVSDNADLEYTIPDIDACTYLGDTIVNNENGMIKVFFNEERFARKTNTKVTLKYGSNYFCYYVYDSFGNSAKKLLTLNVSKQKDDNDGAVMKNNLFSDTEKDSVVDTVTVDPDTTNNVIINDVDKDLDDDEEADLAVFKKNTAKTNIHKDKIHTILKKTLSVFPKKSKKSTQCDTNEEIDVVIEQNEPDEQNKQNEPEIEAKVDMTKSQKVKQIEKSIPAGENKKIKPVKSKQQRNEEQPEPTNTWFIILMISFAVFDYFIFQFLMTNNMYIEMIALLLIQIILLVITYNNNNNNDNNGSSA